MQRGAGMIITIDGPTASGKSSVSQEVARRHGLYYVYSGLLYRALAYVLIHEYGYTNDDLQQPNEQHVKHLCKFYLRYEYILTSGPLIAIPDNDNIVPFLKTKELDVAASILSRDPIVRLCIVDFQKRLAESSRVIADGRDCGTVVFPHAEYKFFLTADLTVRAQRWQKYQAREGKEYSIDVCKQVLIDRDNRDMKRKHSPLKSAADAILIDSSTMTFEEVVSQIEQSIA